MNPRSLVGMTQGARKRKARRLASAIEPGELWRSRYRTGERLNHCPGCAACDLRYTRTIRTYIMRPWGWPVGAADPFRHVDIPDGTPCRLLHYYGDANNKNCLVKVKIGSKRFFIEGQYVFTDLTRICDGTGVLPTKTRGQGKRTA